MSEKTETEINVSVTDDGASLSIVGQDLEALPDQFFAQYSGGVVTKIDLSHNQLTHLPSLKALSQLRELVVDSNVLESLESIPELANLSTLCVNDNNIADLETCCELLIARFPKLNYLSMLKNPACPNFFTNRGQEDYKRYRLRVIHLLPSLKFLDSNPVTPGERAEAHRVGQFLKVARMAGPAPSAQQVEEEQQRQQRQQQEQMAQSPAGKPRAVFGRTRYSYVGKSSEGNRFIYNQDL